MSRLKEYIVEKTMSFDDALKVFNISAEDVADKASLKTTYRKLAMQHHPDKGGDEDIAKDINNAYEILSKSKGSVRDKFDWEERDKKYKMAGVQIKTALLSNFQPDVFIKYFQDLSGLKFYHKIVKTYPSEKEKSPSYAGFDAEFFTKDRSSVFTFKVHANLTDIVWPKAELGHADLSYTVYTEAHGFHMNKKQKMSRSDWGWTRDHSFFRKPEQLFPKKKMEAIFSGTTSKRKFKKRDMEAFLSKKLNAKLEYSGGQTQAAIPLGDNEEGMPYVLIIYRTTFDRVGMWMGNGIYLKKGKYGYGSRVSQTPMFTFPEDEDIAKIFEKVQKDTMKVKGEAKVKKANDLLKFAYEAYKKSKGF
jgi:curved DNA-binding protein CbpA